MLNYTAIGLGSWICGFVLLMFHSISTITNSGDLWRDLKLADVGLFNAMGDYSFLGIENGINYMMNMPLFALLFSLGLVLFILNGFSRFK